VENLKGVMKVTKSFNGIFGLFPFNRGNVNRVQMAPLTDHDLRENDLSKSINAGTRKMVNYACVG